MKHLLVLASILLLTACGNELVDRAVAVQAETLNFLCDCSVSNGVYPNRAACEADNPNLAPFTDAQQSCLERVVDGASSADISALECSFDATESQVSCFQALGCMPDAAASEACADEASSAFAACPQPSEITSAMFATCLPDDDDDRPSR